MSNGWEKLKLSGTRKNMRDAAKAPVKTRGVEVTAPRVD